MIALLAYLLAEVVFGANLTPGPPPLLRLLQVIGIPMLLFALVLLGLAFVWLCCELIARMISAISRWFRDRPRRRMRTKINHAMKRQQQLFDAHKLFTDVMSDYFKKNKGR